MLRGSPHRSFFLSENWVTCWLEVFGAEHRAATVRVESSGETVATAVLSGRMGSRGGIPVRQLFLNTAGESSSQNVCAQYNAVPHRPGLRQLAYESLGKHLLGSPWDEFVVEGTLPDVVAAFRSAMPGIEADIDWRQDYFVDLAALRRSGRPHESVLSRNTKEQVRRSKKIYAQSGELHLTKPASADEAVRMLDELAELHQRAWQARGQPGSFSSESFLKFHRLLVLRGFADGSVQLLRISAGTTPIGMLYSFAYDGEVSSYQSGFNYSADNRLKPGLVSHSLAIQHYLEAGYDSYHFLAGPESTSRHKRSLSTHRRPLGWVVFRRPNLKNRLIDRLRAVKAFVTGPLARPDGGGDGAGPDGRMIIEERRSWRDRRSAARSPDTNRRRSTD